jgi:hypothetical protein
MCTRGRYPLLTRTPASPQSSGLPGSNPMADIEVTVDIPRALLELDSVRYDQVPFALSLAINRTAVAARDAQADGMLSRFKARRPARMKKSVVVRSGTKQDPEATVSVRDPWLVQFEDGGTRRPGDVYDSMAHPLSGAPARRGVIRGSTSPRGVLQGDRKAFVATMKSGKVGVFRRRRKMGRLPIDLVFALERESNLPALLKFEQTVGFVAAFEWENIFGQALAEAYAKRRR